MAAAAAVVGHGDAAVPHPVGPSLSGQRLFSGASSLKHFSLCRRTNKLERFTSTNFFSLELSINN